MIAFQLVLIDEDECIILDNGNNVSLDTLKQLFQERKITTHAEADVNPVDGFPISTRDLLNPFM